MKPFERGVNFFIEGYLHDVVSHHHVESQTFYLRASLCKILISSFASKMDFAHNFSVDFF